MQELIKKVEDTYRKKQVVDVHSGDTVRVHQKIKEGAKERVQVFEGFVIRTDRKNSVTSRITVRRISGGIGVEKSFLLHSPLVVQIEVVKRAKVRRKNLSFMRERSGKSARLAGVEFDKESVNSLDEMIDAELGEAEKSKNTDVTKKDKLAEKITDEKESEIVAEKTEQVTEEKTADAKPDTTEDVKPETEKKESKTEAQKKEASVEEKEQLTKKEKAEAFRKKQEEKNK